MLLTGAIEVNAVAQGAWRRFTQWPWIEHPTFQLTGGHYITELSLPQRNVRRAQVSAVRWCCDVPLGRYWETNDRRKWMKLALTIYWKFMQCLLYQILRGETI